MAKAKAPAFTQPAHALIAAGITLPAPILSALEGRAAPLAIGTFTQIEKWCADHNYTPVQIQVLRRVITRLTRSKPYQRALVSRDAQRVDLDGKAVGPVAAEHQRGALEELSARRKARTQQAQTQAVQQQRALGSAPAPVVRPAGQPLVAGVLRRVWGDVIRPAKHAAPSGDTCGTA